MNSYEFSYRSPVCELSHFDSQLVYVIRETMEVINSSLMRRFAENLYESRIKIDNGPSWKSPREYSNGQSGVINYSELTLLMDLDIVRKLGNETRVYSRRIQLGEYKCLICSNENYDVRYTRKARLEEHLDLHQTGW